MIPDPMIGRTLGDYEIIDLLGQGGMARVYQGHDTKLDRFAAVKVVHADLTHVDIEEYQQRFTREARAIARLQHPNIVGIYQFGQEESLYFMAMQFIKGWDLRAVLNASHARDQQMPLDQVLGIVRDIGSALDYAHAQGVIHRDIKPSNIMITAENKAILTDFGLALHVLEGTLGNTFGTAHYIAPEQAMHSADAVPQSDLYSLGVVLYEMLTGQVPFDDNSSMSVVLKHLTDSPPSPRQHNPALGPELEKVVLRALQKEPVQRFLDGKAMAEALTLAMAAQKQDEDGGERDTVPLVAKGDVETTPPDELPEGGVTLQLRPELAAVLAEEKTVIFPKSSPQAKALAADSGSETLLLSPEQAVSVRNKRRLSLWIGLVVVLIVLVAIGLIAPGDGRESGTIMVGEPTASSAGALATETFIQATSGSETSTASPGSTITPMFSEDEPAVWIIYDERQLLLINRTGRDVNIADWRFQRIDADSGEEIRFSASSWSGGTASPSALPPDECFQVWRNDLDLGGQQMSFDETLCQNRAAFWIASSTRWFWVSDDPSAVFDVMIQFDQPLATCEVTAGRCAVILPAG